MTTEVTISNTGHRPLRLARNGAAELDLAPGQCVKRHIWNGGPLAIFEVPEEPAHIPPAPAIAAPKE